MFNRAALLALTCSPLCSAEASQIFDVEAFGAKGDGSTVNSAAFRDACSAAAAAGGGTVRVPTGDFVTGAFNLSSGVTLEVQAGGTVIGAADLMEFPVIPALPSYGVSRDKNQEFRHQALVMASDSSNVRIIGDGVIDGNGKYWWDQQSTLEAGRPRLVELQNCTDIEVAGVTLLNSGFWTLHPIYSRRVWIHDINITIPLDAPNGDGIDPDSSQDVLIENCDITAGDDHIAIKSGIDEAGRAVGMPTRNVTVRNNIHRAGYGISIGSEVSGGVEDVFVSNVQHLGPSKHGLHLKTAKSRGGYIRNIWYQNVTLGDVESDQILSITTSYSGGTSAPTLTDIDGIHFVNVTRVPGAKKNKKGPGEWSCFSTAPCKNITLTDVHLEPVDGDWKCEFVTNGKVENVSPSGLSKCFKGSNKGLAVLV